MTYWAGLGAAAVAAVLVGTAYIGDQVVKRQDRQDRTVVLYWEKWTGDEETAMRKVVEAFNRSQDRIQVKYLSISGVDTKTMLATAGGNPPDVAGIWVEQVCKFSDENALIDMTGMARESGLTPDYYIKGYWDLLNYRGKLWALPSTPASLCLHVRPDLVPPDVNTPETFPKTIEGMDKVVKRISKKDKDGNLILAGYLPSNPGWWNYNWGYLFGGSLWDGNKFTFTAPRNIKAFTWVQGYAKEFGAKEVQTFQSGFGAFGSAEDPFMKGKVAMELNGPWKANYIRSYKKGTPWFAVPFPYPEDRPDLAGHTGLSMDILAIPRGAKHVKEAFEFIRFVQRQDVMEGLCIEHCKNSPLNKVSEHFFKVHPNPYIRLFDKLARNPTAIGPLKLGVFSRVSDEIGVAFQEINTGRDPRQALQDAQDRVEGQWRIYQAQVLNP